MREIYSNADFTEVGYYKSMLDEAGIASFIRNGYGNNIGGAGALFQPTLCIVADSDYDEALRVLKSRTDPQPAGADGEKSGSTDWVCPSCGEQNPANFGSCWNCSALRPSP